MVTRRDDTIIGVKIINILQYMGNTNSKSEIEDVIEINLEDEICKTEGSTLEKNHHKKPTSL